MGVSHRGGAISKRFLHGGRREFGGQVLMSYTITSFYTFKNKISHSTHLRKMVTMNASKTSHLNYLPGVLVLAFELNESC